MRRSASPPIAGLIAHLDLTGIYYVDAALYVALAAGLLLLPRMAPAAPEGRERS